MDSKSYNEIVRRCDETFVIPVEEGLYCEGWFWFPDMPPEDLEAWWVALENVETFWSVQGRSRWPGTFVRADEDVRLADRWQALWNDGAYRARVEFNECPDPARPDSYLRKADGTVLLHKGAARSPGAGDPGIDD